MQSLLNLNCIKKENKFRGLVCFMENYLFEYTLDAYLRPLEPPKVPMYTQTLKGRQVCHAYYRHFFGYARGLKIKIGVITTVPWIHKLLIIHKKFVFRPFKNRLYITEKSWAVDTINYY